MPMRQSFADQRLARYATPRLDADDRGMPRLFAAPQMLRAPIGRPSATLICAVAPETARVGPQCFEHLYRLPERVRCAWEIGRAHV